MYLGLLDLALVAMSRDKERVVFCYDDDDQLHLQSMGEIANALVFPMTIEGFESSSGRHDPQNTWYVCAARHDWTKGPFQSLNHFMPCWHKDQVPKHVWDFVKCKADSDVASSRLEMAQILATHAQNPGAPSDLTEASFRSVLDKYTVLEKKEIFFSEAERVGLVCQEVPGDGDCGIWSLLALESGPSHEGHTAGDVKLMRTASWIVFDIF